MQMFIVRLINKIKRISVIDEIDVLLKKKSILFCSNGKETDKNFGDAINPILIKQITKKEVVNSSNIINLFDKLTYYFIGSILVNLNKSNVMICGTGFKNKNVQRKV